MMTGTRLKEARKEAGLTLEKLAAEAGVSKQSIALIESGKTKGPRSYTLFKIADTLGVEPRWLATGTGPKQLKNHSNINQELLASIAASISSSAQDREIDLTAEQFGELVAYIYDAQMSGRFDQDPLSTLISFAANLNN